MKRLIIICEGEANQSNEKQILTDILEGYKH